MKKVKKRIRQAWGNFIVAFCHRLTREAVEAPVLEAFKAKCDGVLGSLMQWVAILPMAGGLE